MSGAVLRLEGEEAFWIGAGSGIVETVGKEELTLRRWNNS